MKQTTHIKLIEGRVLETSPSATLEVKRIQLSGYAKRSLGTQVQKIPGARAEVPSAESPASRTDRSKLASSR